MNKIYRLIWNHAAGQWVVSSELTKSRGKRSKLIAAAVAVALALPAAAAMADDSCLTETDAAGTLNAEGVCVADVIVTGGIGLMGALDGGSAPGVGAVSIGPSSRAAGENATAVGSSSTASSSGSVAIGHSANTTTGGNSVAVGYFAKASTGSLAAGARADAGMNSVAVGGYTSATADRSTAVGSSAQSVSVGGTALGAAARAAALNGTAIGRLASVTATGINAVALGQGSIADRGNTISVGAVGAERQIVNVAAGTEDTDAVNVAQLKAIGVIDDNGNTLGAVVYDDDQRDSITLGGTGALQPVTLRNVADGKIEASSTDAINGGQLHTATTTLGEQISQVASGLADGTRYFKANGSNNGNDDATAAGTGSLAIGASANATNRDGIAIGRGATSSTGDGAIAIGSNASATGQNSIALGADSEADRDNVLSVGWGAGGNGTRQIINVANGNEGFDAINVNQLRPVVSALGGGANINAMTGVVTGPSYNVQGNTYNNVGDALDGVDSSLTLIDGQVSDIRNNLESGEIGLVRQDATSRDVSIAAGTDGARIVLSGTAGDRVVSGVASGTADNDAVNLAQLKATGLVGQNGDSLGAVVYDAADKATVSFAGANGTVLKNVAAGDVSQNSKEAVNGGQLYSTEMRMNEKVNGVSDDLSNATRYMKVNSDTLYAPAQALGTGSVSIGVTSKALGNHSIALGSLSVAKSDFTTAVGNASTAEGLHSVAIGNMSRSQADDAVAIGRGTAFRSGAIAIGRSSIAGLPAAVPTAGSKQVAIGDGASATGDQALALGASAKASADNSVALGAGSWADRSNTVSVGVSGS